MTRHRTGALAAPHRNPTVIGMALLVLVAFLQRPGRTTFDTKLDLAVDPLGFLFRALRLWNPESTAGEIQNQAYGYLFPMGPFFAACDALGLPPWIAQRLWCALLLCVAFGGALALARAMRIGTPLARYLGAFGYALAPRMLTEIGPVSAEMLPAVLLPWIMLPLVRAERIGSPRRAAGLSALAVLCVGGINGAMVVMALVLPGLWLLTRAWTRRHVALVLWWCGFVIAVCLWWILPLLLLGQYSLPFLDYIESSANTTAPVSLFQALRGTNQWVAYVVQGEPWWPSGFLLIDHPALMLVTGLVAAVGLYGLTLRGLPERRFLVLSVVTALTLLSIGYVGTLDSPFAAVVRGLLDGPLAPLRNVHKFEPVLRLPLMLAFMHAVSTRAVAPRRARTAVAAGLVVAIAAPAWLLTLRPGPGWDEIPEHWPSALDWVAAQDPGARTLLLPATSFGEYTWGRTVDEPAQALASAPWAVRGQIPLGSEGNTRVMDAVSDAVGSGRGSPGLAPFLARSGHRFVLLRNDIDRTPPGTPPIALLRAGLAASPGIEKVAEFGPGVDTAAVTGASPVDGGVVRAVEVYRVRGAVPRASAVAAADVPTVAGGPESLLPLLDAGLIDPAAPAVLAGDGGDGAVVATDGLRRRERDVGSVHDNLSHTLTEAEGGRLPRRSLDLLPFQQDQTVAVLRGIRSVTASTSAAFADAVGASDPSRLPFAAVDGDPATAWHSSSYTGPVGQWLRVELDTPRVVEEVALTTVADLGVGWPVTRVRVETDTGAVEHDLRPGQVALPTAGGLTSSVRVTVVAVAGGRTEGNVGIAELAIPGVTAQRALKVPADGVAFAFTRGPLPRYPCVTEDGAPRCDRALARTGEEPAGLHRLFSTSAGATYTVGGTVLPRPGGVSPVTAVTASSSLGGDPAVGASAAIDDSVTSTWVAGIGDLRPTLRVVWDEPRDITGLRLSTDPRAAVRPAEIEVRTDAGRERVALDRTGSVELAARTRFLELVLLPPGDGLVGVSDLEVTGAELPAVTPSTPFSLPCGQGPAVTVDGKRYDTAVAGTHADVVAHRPLPLRVCWPGLELPAGEHELSTAPSASFVVQDLWLSSAPPGPTRARDVRVDEWEPTSRAVTVAAGPAAVLAVPENANPGWVATANGQVLERTRVDGWQQAWRLPAGGETAVRLEFIPDRQYRFGLALGALAALAALVVTALPVRRRDPAAAPLARDQVVTLSVRSRVGGLGVQVALAGLVVALGGMPSVVALLVCLLAKSLWRQTPTWIALTGASSAAVVAVIGRLSGHGQDWAYGWLAQGSLLLAVAAVVAACLDWPPEPEDDRPVHTP
ncbi:alpha-(1-_3)-arabinofuranosyltransferase family protein [Actinokineospora guangxiensis]|uniref:Alpha-(1->3)-arabinofuranosyltransferase family protein n=1 Tax=Actinokineospora guangxiensis TaxID=1490288 RepID=A0ABW0EL10_9PSEU